MARTASVFRPFRCAEEAPGKRFNRDLLAINIGIGNAVYNLALGQIDCVAAAHDGFEPQHRRHVEEPRMASADIFENGSIIPLRSDQHAFATPSITKAGTGY